MNIIVDLTVLVSTSGVIASLIISILKPDLFKYVCGGISSRWKNYIHGKHQKEDFKKREAASDAICKSILDTYINGKVFYFPLDDVILEVKKHHSGVWIRHCRIHFTGNDMNERDLKRYLNKRNDFLVIPSPIQYQGGGGPKILYMPSLCCPKCEGMNYRSIPEKHNVYIECRDCGIRLIAHQRNIYHDERGMFEEHNVIY